jgi:hypothetical protein
VEFALEQLVPDYRVEQALVNYVFRRRGSAIAMERTVADAIEMSVIVQNQTTIDLSR